MNIFTRIKSNVWSYCRDFSTVFVKAIEHEIFDDKGNSYIDFFCGAGALNYGHNNPKFKQYLINYIQGNGITHSLDMYTQAKGQFLEAFEETILKSRNLEYKVMFPGPTGTNAVEAALKLARKVKGRPTIVHCKNSFHGVTLGSLSVTDNQKYRNASGVPLRNSYSIPFNNQHCENEQEIDSLDKFFEQLNSLGEKPAAVILEIVQAEGGINVASASWLKQLWQQTQKQDILLIVDDIQVGCGRTGTFFSFEQFGLKPDLVCLSKSISGYGTPMSLLLIRPQLDCWEPGEHNGTFRGNNLAFVTARAAILEYWQNNELLIETNQKASILSQKLQEIVDLFPALHGKHRDRGMIQGIACQSTEIASKIRQTAFQRGLILETAGSHNEVLKLLPPLTISYEALYKGLAIIEESIDYSLASNLSLSGYEKH
ncbi:diaminobutyrate--2-oxoglutarate transaminase [Nostoc sp. DedSLP04]|uniref:diaminobutyrate--2-oxoglutarate transaminase n=1 Tax=Nostoc sp. DedSLP04 TaxID=3075401 RepID=UPI002AD35119|nr:diaminobutyrate--2-oxoglutarate transaminase [Nostoc sp. DedSLP04]MDZ8033655.1 diaminobutyrate--2-oxoglutarate transaminase [Nostoc sp. DedSLP04]